MFSTTSHNTCRVYGDPYGVFGAERVSVCSALRYTIHVECMETSMLCLGLRGLVYDVIMWSKLENTKTALQGVNFMYM